MKNIVVMLLINLVIHSVSSAQVVQDFTLTNVADGKAVSLASFQSCVGIAIIFTSNKCPYDVKYRERIRSLNEQYKGSIQFLLVNSHIDPNENTKAMSDEYVAWAIPVPYLADKEQVAMNCLEARKSPESFLLKRNGSDYSIVYSGAIDDNPLVSNDINNAFLKRAIDQLIKGEKVTVTSNRAAGCTIRKKI